ncbi:glutathione S-transferase family protein [Paenirhodobacter populi]|uniref:Glutathione S-transferase n=1 Tax=Paenirhodobacter populi TaxID=2306993 RepID=A0A443K5A2_9RHOB|nr:hypothetical protein [Sinirhodobacter populi]RWR07400.1 hypothetical protein D2T32_12055 [Sinirhodobacter populi]RWR27873.1 hypothetical protein D2T31_15225 [Sinirhodobacter populi]
MAHVAFSLAAPFDCATAQAAALALLHRGTPFDWLPGAAGPDHGTQLSVVDLEGQEIRAGALPAILDWIEDFHPGQPLHPEDPATRGRHRALLRVAERLPARLSDMLTARTDRDLDIAQHFLLDLMQTFEEEAARADARLSNVDLALAPVLWRIALLDRDYATHILAPLRRLRGRHERILSLAPTRRALNAAAERRFHDRIGRSAGLIATGGNRNDWSRALGPFGA